MSEWKEYSLSDLMEIKGGGTPKTNIANYWNGNIPWVSVTDFSNNSKYIYKTERMITDEGLKNSSTKMLKEGEIIISARGTVGAISMIGKEMAFNQTCYGLNANENITSNNFLFYLLKDNVDQFHSFSYGAVFDTITRDTFNHILVSVPPLHEQKAIASVLSSLDDKIELLQKQNENLEKMANQYIEFYKSMIIADEQTLGNFIEIFDNKRIPISKMEREKMKDGFLYPYYGAAGIIDYVNDYLFDGEFILVGEDGTVITENEKPVLQIVNGKFWVSNHAHIFQAQKPYSNYLVYCLLKNTNISNIVTGAVQPKINQENLKSIRIPKFSDSVLRNLNSFLIPIFSKISLNSSQLYLLKKLRDTLLPKLMSGVVRVKY